MPNLSSPLTAMVVSPEPERHNGIRMIATPATCALRYHPEYNTERPFFEHRSDMLTDNGRQHCPYVNLEAKGTSHIRQLQWYVPDARLLVYRAGWHCSGCDSNYHGERYCLTCRTGEFSRALSDAEIRTAEVTACAY